SRVEARRRGLALDARQDHCVIAHRAADKTALSGKRRRRAFADDPEIAIAMPLTPGIVVVIVDAVGYRAADDRTHAFHHPFAADISILPREFHAGDILSPELTVVVKDGRLDIDALFPARELNEGRCGFVSEPTRTKVHADPAPARLVFEQIDIMVAGAD